jgi:alkylation response protein AidB-like acyl-CoA dehydrogenase
MNPILKTFITEGLGVDESALPDAGQAKVSIPTAVPTERILTDEMLARVGSRAAAYDAENHFFEADFKELRAAGYLLLPVPVEFGGAGLTLAEVCREQRRLAYHAPATALALNMHLYWAGVAADLWRRGDRSLEWLLREVAAGEVFAAGHAESGNDVPLLLSTTKAEPVDGNNLAAWHPFGPALACTEWIPAIHWRQRWCTHSSRANPKGMSLSRLGT